MGYHAGTREDRTSVRDKTDILCANRVYCQTSIKQPPNCYAVETVDTWPLYSSLAHYWLSLASAPDQNDEPRLIKSPDLPLMLTWQLPGRVR